MKAARKHPWWTSKRAALVVVDRAVHGGWGATLRLTLVLVVLIVGMRLVVDGIPHHVGRRVSSGISAMVR
jgi:hypothetical protein